MPGPNYVEISNSNDKWDALAEFIGTDAEHLSNPSSAGLTIFDNVGKMLNDKNSIEQAMLSGGVYILSDEYSGAFHVLMDDTGMIKSTEDPIGILGIVPDLPEKPERAVIQPAENLDETLNSILNINDLRTLPGEERALAEIVKAKCDKLPRLYEGQKLPKGFIGDVKMEDFLPPEPTPLTAGQQRWDKFVKFFNGKGSKKGVEYRATVAARDKIKLDFSKWRNEYNVAYAKLREDAREEAREQIELKNKKEELKNEKKYVQAARAKLSSRPVAAYMDYQKNGLTVENISGYEYILETNLNNMPIPNGEISDDMKKTIAEYLLISDINNTARARLGSAEYVGLSDVNLSIQTMNNPNRKADAIEAFMKGDQFNAVIDALAGEKKLNLKKIITSYKDAKTLAPLIKIESREKLLIDQLAEEPVNANTEQLLVKLCMVNELKSEYKKTHENSPNTIEGEMKEVATRLKKLEIDYRESHERLKELYTKGVEKLPNVNSPSELMKMFNNGRLDSKVVTEQLELMNAKKNDRVYNEILQKYPQIKTIVNEYKGSMLPKDSLDKLLNVKKAPAPEAEQVKEPEAPQLKGPQ